MAKYIDKDKIGLTDFEMIMCDGNYKEALKMLLDKIEKLPSEDVQPVKHGRWIDGDCRCVTAVCSNCNHLRLGNGAKSAMRLALYCEKCGARMDGGG